MEWIEWGFIIFCGTMLALLIYSIVSTSGEIRKKVQPSLDSFFEGLPNVLFRRGSSSRRDRSRSNQRKF
jgi:hypothetical protein